MTTTRTIAPIWTAPQPLILASRSEARRALLSAAGIAFEAKPADIDEREVERQFRSAGGNMAGLASALAEAKAVVASRENPEAWTLGADQVLLLDGQALHKPADRASAGRSLTSLAGRTHWLISAFCLARAGRPVGGDEDRARLTMRPLGSTAIDRYLDLAAPAVLSSVGAYQLEGVGVHLFERIEGDHSTILGLPMLRLLALLRSQGLLSL